MHLLTARMLTRNGSHCRSAAPRNTALRCSSWQLPHAGQPLTLNRNTCSREAYPSAHAFLCCSVNRSIQLLRLVIRRSVCAPRFFAPLVHMLLRPGVVTFSQNKEKRGSPGCPRATLPPSSSSVAHRYGLDLPGSVLWTLSPSSPAFLAVTAPCHLASESREIPCSKPPFRPASVPSAGVYEAPPLPVYPASSHAQGICVETVMLGIPLLTYGTYIVHPALRSGTHASQPPSLSVAEFWPRPLWRPT